MMNARMRHRNVKPEGALEIDWAHAFAADLLVAVCPAEGAGPLRDLVSGNRSTSAVNGSWGVLKSGRAVSFTNTQYNVIATRPQARLSSGYTVLWGGSFKAPTAGWDSWGGLFCLPSNAGGKSLVGIQRDSSLATLQLFHNDTAGVVLNTNITTHANSELVIGASWDGSTVREFRNGTLVKTATPTFAPTGTPDNKLHINSERSLGGEAAQTLSFLYVFARRLPDDVIASLSAQPFQILKTRRTFVGGRQSEPLPAEAEVVPGDLAHGHGGDQAQLTQIHAVAPGAGRQGQAADAVGIAQTHGVVPFGAGHGQLADAGGVTVGSQVAGANGWLAQAADAVPVVQQHSVSPVQARSSQAADSSYLLPEGVRPPPRRTGAVSGEIRRVTVGRVNPVLKPRKH